MSNCLAVTFVLLGSLFAILYVSFPALIEAGLRSQFVLAEGNEYMKNWLDVPLPVDYKFYFFNIENPREAANGAKVRVRQVGPYCFKYTMKRRILGWGPNKATVKFEVLRKYDFSPELSAPLTLDDKLTVVNVPMAGVGAVLGDIVADRLPFQQLVSPLVFAGMTGFFDAHNQQLFQTFSVRELIMGYRIRFADTLNSVVDPLRNLGLIPDGLMPEGAPNNTFGLLYGKHLPDGPYEIFTGQDGTSSRFTQLVTWKGKAELDWWSGDYCNAIRGSDGSQFPLFFKKTDRLYAFSPDVCRTLFITYSKDTDVRGIPVQRFVLDKGNYANAETEAANACFCPSYHKKRPKRCSIGGLFDLGGCAGGAPLVLSLPHFGETEPDISKSQVEGLNFDPQNHTTYLDIDPYTGSGLRASKKLMFSVRLERNTLFRQFQNIRPAYVPFAWAEESAELNEEIAGQLKTMLFNPIYYADYVLPGGAAVFSSLAVVAFLVGRMKSKAKIIDKEMVKPVSPVFVKVKPKSFEIERETSKATDQNLADSGVKQSVSTIRFPKTGLNLRQDPNAAQNASKLIDWLGQETKVDAEDTEKKAGEEKEPVVA